MDSVDSTDDQPTLALTFDACGGPGGAGYDAALIALLRRERIQATLFLNERWVRSHLRLTVELASDPLFAIGNHGSRHVPLSVSGRSAYGIRGTRSPAEAIEEVESNQRLLARVTGARPNWFRAGTAHYDDVAVRLVRERSMRVAGFTVNGDAGATAAAPQIQQALEAAPAGAIVLMHMNQPRSGAAQGLAAALPELRARGTRFVAM